MTSTHTSSISDADITMHEQMEELQLEMDKLRTSNEALKISGRGKNRIFFFFPKFFFFYKDLLERAPPLIDLPHRSNMLQETLKDIIQKHENEIQRLRDELEREKCLCLISIHELELKLEEQLKKFTRDSYELQKNLSIMKCIY
jgi:hypothetical protein